jgi:hypothetical protein
LDAGTAGSGGTQGGSGGVQGGSGGVQGGSGGTQGGSGGTGGSNCKNPAFVDCGTGCVDLTSDVNNCGMCNNPCTSACVDSVCATAQIDFTCHPGAPFKIVQNPNVPSWNAFALYDMNADHKLDVVGGNLYEIDVHTGVGDGTFNAGVPTGDNDGYRLAAGDFDGDGHGDVAAWDLTFAYGEAAFGTFTALSYTPPMMFWGGFAQSTLLAPIAAGDFDGDGRTDIAEFTSGNNGVSEMFVMQNRNYASSSTVAIGGTATAIAAGDFSGDGHDDVALVIPGTSLLIYPSPLDANTAITLPADNSGSSLAFGKFNPDAKADIVVAHPNVKEVGVVLSTAVPGTGIYPIPIHATIVVAGDFTGDGHDDIVALSNVGLVILPGTGQGGFGAPLGPFAIAGSVTEAHVGDVSGDGTLDIVRSLNSGSGGYGVESLVTCPPPPVN